MTEDELVKTSMDTPTADQLGLRQSQYIEVLDQLPADLKTANNSCYLTSFCLKCRTANVSAKETLHGEDDCFGVIVLIHKNYTDAGDGIGRGLAVKCVEEEIKQLSTEGTHRETVLNKYSGFVKTAKRLETKTKEKEQS